MAEDCPPRPWSSADEQDLLFEIAEDNRLRAIGIDPDMPWLLQLLELDRRCALILEKRERQREGG